MPGVRRRPAPAALAGARRQTIPRRFTLFLATFELRDTFPAPMRFDPRSRLDRRLPGEGFGQERTLRLHIDESRELPVDPVPARDQAELFSVTQRPTKRLAEAGPNAPQLIRLIRFPYAHAVDRAKRVPFGEARPTTPKRAPLGLPMREAGVERGEVLSARPDLSRPKAFAPRVSSAQPIPPSQGAKS